MGNTPRPVATNANHTDAIRRAALVVSRCAGAAMQRQYESLPASMSAPPAATSLHGMPQGFRCSKRPLLHPGRHGCRRCNLWPAAVALSHRVCLMTGSWQHWCASSLQRRSRQRNTRLFWAACRMAGMVASRLVAKSEAEAVLIHAAMHAGLSENEARKTANSGLTTGGAG